MVDPAGTEWSQKMIGLGLDVRMTESGDDLRVPRNVLRARLQNLNLLKTNVIDVLSLSSN
jgi:hypothetical protein